MRRGLPFLILGFLLAVAPAPLRAQAPPALPAVLTAQVGLPGSPARFANVSMEFGAPDWAVVGCIASSPSVCFATQHVVLTAEQRVEFVRLWTAVASMPRCEPAAFAPGDPAFELTTSTAHYGGHLPAASSDLPARTAGACAADARLAWWLAQRVGA